MKPLKIILSWLFIGVISLFLLNACYTQIAKKRVVTEESYTAEEEYPEEEYESEEENYTQPPPVRHYHYNINYYGFFGPPWWYDPFFVFPPYWNYDYYTVYPSHFDFFIGYYYDPFFYDPLLWCPTYSYFYYGSPYYSRHFFAIGVHHFFGPDFFVGSGGKSIPVKKRPFSRRGNRFVDDFGYQPPPAVSNSKGYRSQKPRSTHSKQTRRRRRPSKERLNIYKVQPVKEIEKATISEGSKNKRRKKLSNSEAQVLRVKENRNKKFNASKGNKSIRKPTRHKAKFSAKQRRRHHSTKHFHFSLNKHKSFTSKGHHSSFKRSKSNNTFKHFSSSSKSSSSKSGSFSRRTRRH